MGHENTVFTRRARGSINHVLSEHEERNSAQHRYMKLGEKKNFLTHSTLLSNIHNDVMCEF